MEAGAVVPMATEPLVVMEVTVAVQLVDMAVEAVMVIEAEVEVMEIPTVQVVVPEVEVHTILLILRYLNKEGGKLFIVVLNCLNVQGTFYVA